MLEYSKHHLIPVVHPFPDRPFDFRTYPRDAITAAFDPDGRSTVRTSVPIAGHLTVLHQGATINFATSEPALLADALGPCQFLDPDGDTLGHETVTLLDGDGLRVFHVRNDSEPRLTGQYRVVETRIPGRCVDDPRPDLTASSRELLGSWIADCIERAIGRREGFELWPLDLSTSCYPTVSTAVTNGCLEVTRLNHPDDGTYQALARIPLAAGAADVASSAMLDELATQAVSPFDTWPVYKPRLGDTAIDPPTIEATNSESDPVEQTSGDTKRQKPRQPRSQTGEMK